MIKKNNKDVGFILKGTQNIDKIYHGTDLVFEQGFTREDSGIPPLTTSHKAIGKNLKDYKIYGNSVQESNLVDNSKIVSSSISDGKIEIGTTGITVKNSYMTLVFNMSDLFEPNTTYYIHCERVYSTTRTNATGRITNYGGIGTLLEYDKEDGSFTTGNELTGYLYFYGFAEGTVEFKNLYIGRLPYTQYEAHKVPSPTTPIEVQSVGERTKNLLTYPYSTMSGTFNNVTFTANKGSFSVTGSATATTSFTRVNFQQIDLKAGTYTLSAKNYGASTNVEDNYIVLYIGTNGYGSSNLRNVAFKSEYNFVVTEDSTVYISFLFRRSLNYNITIEELQIEEGAVSTHPYEPYGYKIPVKASGKNLIPYPYYDSAGIREGITWVINEDGSIKGTGTTTLGTNFHLYKNNLTLKAGTYTLSVKGKHVGAILYFRNEDVSPAVYYFIRSSNDDDSVTFTLDNDVVNSRIYFNAGNAGINVDIDCTIQLEEGSTATSHEHASTTTNIFLDAPLRKIGNYTDYIDFENSKVVRNIDEYVFTGSETYIETSYTDLFWISFTNYNNGGFCNYFDYLRGAGISGNASAASNLANNQISFRLGNTKDRVYIKSNQFVSAEDFKTWVVQNNVALCYITDTPTEESITLPSIPSIKGITIYTIDTNIKPSNMYVKYKGK